MYDFEKGTIETEEFLVRGFTGEWADGDLTQYSRSNAAAVQAWREEDAAAGKLNDVFRPLDTN